jgi:hypothetical protein
MYDLGTLKVVWTEDNIEYLDSDMFKPGELDEAVKYGQQKGDYMIMQLVGQKKDLYRWRLLPFGTYKQYLKGVKLSKKIKNLFGNNESSYSNETEAQATIDNLNARIKSLEELHKTAFIIIAIIILLLTFLYLNKHSTAK